MSLSAQELYKGERYIEVTGGSTIETTPDIAYISITIDEDDAAIKSGIDAAQKKMYSAISGVGIDVEKDLTVDRISSTYIKRKESGQVRKYTLKVTDISKVQDVFSALDNAGISNANVTSTDLSQKEEITKRARALAVKSAYEKAATLAQAAGVELGQVLVINDYTSGGNISNRLMSKGAYSEAADMISLDFDDVVVSGSVRIIYSIK